MAVEEERTGFEWMDTPFIITRTLVTLLGGACLVLVFAATFGVIDYLLPLSVPPTEMGGDYEREMELEARARSASWRRERVFARLGFSLLFASLPVSGMILVWRNPRLAFRLTAGGWLLFGVPGFVESVANLEPIDWNGPPLLLLPPLWLGFASCRCRSRAQ